MQESQSIFNKNWDLIDKDAEGLHMNRSQFIDYLYRFWKTRFKKIDRIVNYIMLLLLLTAVVLLVMIINA